MLYTLEINHINPKENLFFHQTGIATEQQKNEMMEPIYKKHRDKGSFINGNPRYTFRNFQRPTGEWQYVTRIDSFVSIADAVEYFKDIVADGTEFRRLRREWQQENGILNETNILDEFGNIVEVIHACQAHKCIRFGVCPSVGSGCATVPEHTHDGIYPIYHIERA